MCKIDLILVIKKKIDKINTTEETYRQYVPKELVLKFLVDSFLKLKLCYLKFNLYFILYYNLFYIMVYRKFTLPSVGLLWYYIIYNIVYVQCITKMYYLRCTINAQKPKSVNLPFMSHQRLPLNVINTHMYVFCA